MPIVAKYDEKGLVKRVSGLPGPDEVHVLPICIVVCFGKVGLDIIGQFSVCV